MVWHHCYISLPYAAVYLTLWRTVVGFAPSQRRSKRFDSPTIRLPSAETRGRLACQRRRRRRNPYPASALEEGRNPRQVRLARKSKRDSQGESLRRRAREGGGAFSDSWRESGRNPLLLLRSSMLQSEHAYSSRVDAPINLRTIHE